MPTVREHNQCLRLKAAELLMHRPGTYLMLMHTNEGAAYFVVPRGTRALR